MADIILVYDSGRTASVDIKTTASIHLYVTVNQAFTV